MQLESLRQARANLAGDRYPLAGAGNSNATDRDATSAVQQDLKIIERLEIECAAVTDSVRDSLAAAPVPASCSSRPLLNFQVSHPGEANREVPISEVPGTRGFFYESGMTIDADGAPNAYHPDNLGLDDLANAGAPGNWEGLAKDDEGQPYVQGPDDPYPGYFVSATALADRTKPANDPARYVDATAIPYIVLPGGMAREMGARPGDFAAVFNQRNAKASYAIFGDVGPFDRIGEGSIALAEHLEIRSDARNGGAHRGILYLVFPGSGNGRPRTTDEIESESEKLLREWGGVAQLAACSSNEAARESAGIRN